MSGPALKVEEAERATSELVEAFARLVPQLSSSSAPPGRSELSEMAEAPGTTILVSRDGGGEIVGALTLVVFRIPTGLRAWIEDVVVDQGARGRGVGEALVAEALARAAGQGARTVDLTSRPSREAARRLYLRAGFRTRETDVYRYEAP